MLRLSDNMIGPTGARFRLPPMLTYEQMLWWVVARLKNQADIDLWFDAFELLPAERRLLALSAPNAPLGILVLASKPDLCQAEEPEES